MSNEYKLDFTVGRLSRPAVEIQFDASKVLRRGLMGPDIHVKSSLRQQAGEEALWTLFSRVSPTCWQNNCMSEFEASRDALERALTQPDSLPDAYARLARIYDEAFHPNYTDLLLPPNCALCGVAYVNGYQQMSSVFDVTRDNVFRTNELMDSCRNHMIFAGVYNQSQNHYVGWIIAFPVASDTEGVILILDPFGVRDNTECVDRLCHIAHFLAHQKVSERVCRFTERRAPRMRIVYVSHPPDLTQGSDLCCNFWSSILVTAWISFYRSACRMDTDVFLDRLRKLFPSKQGAYDFRELGFMYAVERDQRLTMASLRTYTLLFMQCLFQLADVLHACQCLDMTAHEKYHAAIVHASLPEARKILEKLCAKLGSDRAYVLAGSEAALDHYYYLVKRWESVKADSKARRDLIQTLPAIDLFRIFLSRFEDKDHRNVNEAIVTGMMVLRQNITYEPMLVCTVDSMKASTYKYDAREVYDPENITVFTPKRKDEVPAAAFAARHRPAPAGGDDGMEIDLSED